MNRYAYCAATASTVSGDRRLGSDTRECEFVHHSPSIATNYRSYSVKGWCVRQARLKDTISGEWKEGDILYEVSLARTDTTPMEEVTRRPTNMEVDDYTEYKRLRKLHREHKRKGPGTITMPPKAAPPIPPLQLPFASPVTAPQSLLRVSPSISRKTTFKEPAFDAPKASLESDRPYATDVVSPMTVPGLQESFFAPKKSGTLAIPIKKDKNKMTPTTSSDNTSRNKHARVLSPAASSLTSSTQSVKSELKEIIPWIELEATLPTPPPMTTPPVGTATDRLEVKAAELNPVKSVRRLARDSRQPSDLSMRSQISQRSQKKRKTDTATNALNLRLYSAKPMLGRKKEASRETEKEKHAKRLLFGKKSKFLDGAGYSADEEVDPKNAPSCSGRARFTRSSSEEPPQLHSPTPMRPAGPQNLFALGHGIEDIEFSSPLDDLVSGPKMATPISTPMSPPVLDRGVNRGTGESVAMGRLKRWLSK